VARAAAEAAGVNGLATTWSKRRQPISSRQGRWVANPGRSVEPVLRGCLYGLADRSRHIRFRITPEVGAVSAPPVTGD